MMWVKAAVAGLLLAVAAQDAPNPDEKKQKDEEARAKVDEFKAELKKAKMSGDICFALQNLGGVQHPRILSELQKWLARPEPDICGAAADQIAKYQKDRIAAEMLMMAAKGRRDRDSNEPMIRCLRSAGDVGYRPIARQFVSYFRHKDVYVAKEAVDSLGKLKSKDGIDPLLTLARELDAIREDQGQPGGVSLPGVGGPALPGGAGNQQNDDLMRKNTLLPAVLRALSDITGENKKDSKEWDQWWRKERSKFKEQPE